MELNTVMQGKYSRPAGSEAFPACTGADFVVGVGEHWRDE